MPELSVIIPVFNTEQYLARCLESVCAQSFSDMEIICVNDCSTDASSDILRHYAGIDTRIRVIDLQENAGVADARNRGLDAATGRYVCFVDSDDWIEHDHFVSLHDKIESTGAAVVTNSNYVMEYQDTGKQSYSDFRWVVEGGSDLPSAYVQRLFPPVVWASMYRRDHIETFHIRFPDFKCGEDICFVGLCCLLTDRVHVYKGPAYHYSQRSGSLMHSKGRGILYLRSFKAMRDEVLKHGANVAGAKLFFVENLFIEDADTFDFIKSYMSEICDEVKAAPETYSDLDRFLMDVALTAPDYDAFRQKYNPNISMSFIRSRMSLNRQ